MTLSSLRPGDLRPELLAPAGDMDCARAAVTNGADAIYFGLDRFNARLRANNFTLDSLPELMRFLHAHGVRGYVTMNTLLFTSELADALTYLGHLNAAGVDGVIVQDIGLARCLTEWGRQDPAMKLELHASTQMTLSSPDGLEFAAGFLDLKQAYAIRIFPWRCLCTGRSAWLTPASASRRKAWASAAPTAENARRPAACPIPWSWTARPFRWEKGAICSARRICAPLTAFRTWSAWA